MSIEPTPIPSSRKTWSPTAKPISISARQHCWWRLSITKRFRLCCSPLAVLATTVLAAFDSRGRSSQPCLQRLAYYPDPAGTRTWFMDSSLADQRGLRYRSSLAVGQIPRRNRREDCTFSRCISVLLGCFQLRVCCEWKAALVRRAPSRNAGIWLGVSDRFSKFLFISRAFAFSPGNRVERPISGAHHSLSILVLAWLAHPIPVLWLLGVAAYVLLARQLSPKLQLFLLLAALGVMVVLRQFLLTHYKAFWLLETASFYYRRRSGMGIRSGVSPACAAPRTVGGHTCFYTRAAPGPQACRESLHKFICLLPQAFFSCRREFSSPTSRNRASPSLAIECLYFLPFSHVP